MPAFMILTVEGFLSRDPEVVQFDNGGTIAKFSLGVETGTQENSKKEWFEVIVPSYLPLYNYVTQYVKSGDTVVITGDFGIRHWQKDGQERQSLGIRAHSLSRRPRKNPNEASSEGENGGQAAKPPQGFQRPPAPASGQRAGQPQQRSAAPPPPATAQRGGQGMQARPTANAGQRRTPTGPPAAAPAGEAGEAENSPFDGEF